MFKPVVLNLCRLMCLLALAGSASPASAKEQQQTGAGPTFAWPAPMEFQVEETTAVNGSKTVFRHTLSFVRENNEYLLAWVGTECLEAGGQKIRGDKLREAVRGMEAMVASRPPMKISPSGEYLGAVMTPEVIARLVQRREQAYPSLPQKEQKEFEQELNSPSGMETFGRILGQHWNAWVGQWRNAPAVSNTSTSSEVPMFLGQGIFVSGEMMFNNHGRVRGNKGEQVRLTSEELTTGPKFARALSNAMSGFDQPLIPVRSAERLVSYETVIDLATLLPSTASRKVIMKMEVEGKAPSTKVEEHEYRFFWPDGAKGRKSVK